MASQDDPRLDDEDEQWLQAVLKLKAGEKDDEGETITLVYRIAGTFAVYITSNGVKHLSRVPLAGRFGVIANATNELNHYRVQFPFIDMAVAQAKSACFEDGQQQALEVIRSTQARVLHLLTGAGRLRYALVCMTASAIVLVTVSLMSVFRVPQEHLFVAWMIACGSIGAFLSVSANLNRLEIDPASPAIMTSVSAVSRVIIGMIGAAVILLLIRGHLVLGLLADLNNPQALLAVGVLAGFSETFVPNVLRRVESQNDADENKRPLKTAAEGSAPPAPDSKAAPH